jgi:hypothetical protein
MINPFESVQGWIELGDFTEAANELQGLPSKLKSTIEYVQKWVLIYSATGAWTNVEAVCDTLLLKDPADEFGAHHKAEALHRQGRTPDAIIFLGETPYGQRTGDGLYLLARLLSHNRQFDDAISVLTIAFDCDRSLRLKALDDLRFKEMWGNIRAFRKMKA